MHKWRAEVRGCTSGGLGVRDFATGGLGIVIEFQRYYEMNFVMLAKRTWSVVSRNPALVSFGALLLVSLLNSLHCILSAVSKSTMPPMIAASCQQDFSLQLLDALL